MQSGAKRTHKRTHHTHWAHQTFKLIAIVVRFKCSAYLTWSREDFHPPKWWDILFALNFLCRWLIPINCFWKNLRAVLAIHKSLNQPFNGSANNWSFFLYALARKVQVLLVEFSIQFCHEIWYFVRIKPLDPNLIVDHCWSEFDSEFRFLWC